MRCLSPITFPRPYGRGNNDLITVPCSICINCLSNLRNDWTFRLVEENKKSIYSDFITLTYDDEQLIIADGNTPTLLKRDLQLFLKRLRQYLSRNIPNYQNDLRYFLVGEYGSKTDRPHYHGILFNIPINNKTFREIEVNTILQNTWKKGRTSVGTVTQASIHYITKYMINPIDNKEIKENQFRIMSTRPGLGSNYLSVISEHQNKIKTDITYQPGGIKSKIPRYYSSKIFGYAKQSEISNMKKKYVDAQLNEEQKRVEELGMNYFEYELNQKNQRIDFVHEQITKNKKL